MKEEFESLEELQEFLNQQAALQNATSREETDNLSPNDMYMILYYTFEKESPLAFNENISSEIFREMPFVKLSKEFLSIIYESKELKLTSRGYLPPKICKELYNKKNLLEDSIESGIVKLHKEADSIVIQNLKIISTLAGLIKKRRNKLSITNTGKKIIEKNLDFELFKKLFLIYSKKFNLGCHDGYPQNVGVQSTLGYTLYLLLRYGEKEKSLEFYVGKNILAFPHILENFHGNWSTPEKRYAQCYRLRIFDRFLNYFGLVSIRKVKNSSPLDEKWKIKTTEAFQKTFKINPDNFRFIKSKNWA